MYYLDNAATTRPHPQAIEKARQCMTGDFGNPSSVHPLGVQAGRVVDDSRKTLSEIFQVPLAGIIFCGSGTESDNLAIKGVLCQTNRFRGRFVTSKLEHAAVLKTAEWLEQCGVEVDYVRIDPQTGQIDIAHLEELIEPATRLISIQHVNSETGIVQDLSSISKVVKAKNPKTLFHSDGVQAFTKFPVNLKTLGLDLYSISGHKFHGIKGAGALILTGKLALETLLHGGGQEFGIRSGTENVPAIAALGLAARISSREMEQNSRSVLQFSSWFKTKLKQRFQKISIFDVGNAVPHIISLSVPGVPGEVLLHHLAERKIYISTGSACNAKSKKISPVLQTLGFSRQKVGETVRISMAAGEIPTDHESFFDTFSEAMEELCGIV
ncbi:MAG: cysteine desulfurase [Proteobacteria bacterium]|nr:cysteine desulfurase [Pseudomonadota bacterium]